MTTDTELHDLLSAEAGGPTTGASWDDVVRRGRHRQRVRRAQRGALAALAVGAVVTGIALSGDGPTVETVPPASDPTTTTVDAPGTADSTIPYFVITAARAQGVFLTVPLAWADPDHGFDACADLHPRVVESSSEIGFELVGEAVEQRLPLAGCARGRNSAWLTIELQEPVGDRAVVDLARGFEVVVVDGASLLVPGELPQPFELDRREEWGGGAADEDGVLAERGSWTFSWYAGMSELRVTTGEAAGPRECEGEREDVVVRGTSASLCTGVFITGVGVSRGVTYDLRWEEDGRVIGVWYGSDDPASLSLDDVLAIADGLEPLGG